MSEFHDPAAPTPVVPQGPSAFSLTLDEARISPASYWGSWQRTNATAIIEHCFTWLERVGSIKNFDDVANGSPASERRGREFTDSDVYKLLEAMVWEAYRAPNAELEEHIVALTRRIGAAQQPDGYLNTNFGRPGQAPRYSDMAWGHELYCYGHLLQAVVARTRTAGRDELFEIGIRVAEHVCEVFGTDGLQTVCGHPEIEVALIELARLTGNDAFRQQAALFIERRGHGVLPAIEFGPEYFQDDVPVRTAEVLRGHAVRALYLASGAVDLAVDTGDGGLLSALERQWSATVARRTYVTGGMGSHHQDESFGGDFELPPDRAYCETCAGVGSIMFSWRLLLATGDSRYADLIERTLHNILVASPAPDGRSFFYTNTLHQRVPGQAVRSDDVSPRSSSNLREPWFEVSCCPPNVARTLATLATYQATVSHETLTVHQYFDGTIESTLAGGGRVALRVETAYPASGTIRILVEDAPGTEWTLALRVPGWARTATLRLPGGQTTTHAPGTVPTHLRAGDEVILELDLTPRFLHPHPYIDAIRGTVAVQRGPVVYAAESVDLPIGVTLDEIVVDPDTAPRLDDDGRVVVSVAASAATELSWPYAPAPERCHGQSFDLPLIPYSTWAERGPSTMRVWLPTQSTAT